MKPVLFITGNVPEYRVGALRALHEREGSRWRCSAGARCTAAPRARALPFPAARPLRRARATGASGAYRAVRRPARAARGVGRRAARGCRDPVGLAVGAPAHAAHALSYLPLRRLYASADAVVTYGPHVSAYVGRGARNVHVAPQAVDNEFWGAPVGRGRRLPAGRRTRFLFVGRDAPEKGLDVLLDAWRCALRPAGARALVRGDAPPGRPAPALSSPRRAARAPARRLRRVRGARRAVDRHATFREPWGLVVNEAMNRGLPVIATDAVGAAAGGLVRDGHNGLVVPAGDAGALAGRSAPGRRSGARGSWAWRATGTCGLQPRGVGGGLLGGPASLGLARPLVAFGSRAHENPPQDAGALRPRCWRL